MINSQLSRNNAVPIPTFRNVTFRCFLTLSTGVLLALATGCKENAKSAESVPTDQVASSNSGLESVEATAAPAHSLSLPLKLNRWTGDFDGMTKRRLIRALVINSRTGFFYDKGRPRGTTAEALEEFESFVNKKLGNPNPRIKVAYIPVATSQLASALKEGMGDVIASPIVISPERERMVDFTAPLITGVKIVLVTNAAAPSPKTLEDLSGQEVWANPLTAAYQSLATYNESLKKAGKPAIKIVASDKNLTEEDLLEMTNAGLIPATLSFDFRAKFWSQVYTDIRVHPDLAIQSTGDVAWAMRKDSPQLKKMLDEFFQKNGLGTSFGNTVLRRYLQNTKWVKNSASASEMKKFSSYVTYFKKYGQEYNFDYLMLAAQGYQESMLNQDQKSRAGAVGVMQVMPKFAAAKPINITGVNQAEPNIHAGTKMLHYITVTYFNDPGIDATNKTLMTFAAYNAGPARVAKLRKMATEQGLDPNVWFGNVELMAAKDIGQETVQYVSNIFKYYIAYKTTLEQDAIREKAKQAIAGK